MPKSKAAELTTATAVYKAIEDDQISLEEGDFVEIWNKSEDGQWAYGRKVKGKKVGYFPCELVKPMGGKVGSAAAGFLGTLKTKQNDEMPSVVKPEMALKPAQYNTGEFKLQLEQVLQKTTSQEHVGRSQPERPRIPSPIGPVTETNMNAKQLMIAIADYQATSSNQLALQVGDLIQVEKITESGWSNGTLVNRADLTKPLTGWFPTSFVQYQAEQLPGPSKSEEASYLPTFKELHKSTQTVSERTRHLSDTSFESDDDSDYESAVQQLCDSPPHSGAFPESSVVTGRSPIAILTMVKVDAVQVYARKSKFSMHLCVAIATDWSSASAILTTKSAPMKPPSSYGSTTSLYSAEWITNYRLNISHASESLFIKCYIEDASRKDGGASMCLAEARLPLEELLHQSRHLKDFTKGLPLHIHNEELLYPSGFSIMPCLLVKFDIIDIRS